jgi:hypothetical protein
LWRCNCVCMCMQSLACWFLFVCARAVRTCVGSVLRGALCASNCPPPPPPACARQVRAARVRAGQPPCEPSVAAFTAGERRGWAKTRSELRKSGVNAASMDAIETALLCLVLLPDAPADSTALMRACMIGDGASTWFDKSSTMLVCANGAAGFNGEHSSADATVPCEANKMMADWVAAYGGSEAEVDMGPAPRAPRPARLTWELSPEQVAAVGAAEAAAVALGGRQVIASIEYRGFGGALLRASRVPPDSFFQMALQLAYYRDQGAFTATYGAWGASVVLRRGAVSCCGCCGCRYWCFMV